MANWCYNIVNFEGGITVIKQLQKLFEALAQKEEKEKCGQLPEFIKSKDGYLFSIRWEDDTLYYETRWSSNTEIKITSPHSIKRALNYNEKKVQKGEAECIHAKNFLKDVDKMNFHGTNQFEWA